MTSWTTKVVSKIISEIHPIVCEVSGLLKRCSLPHYRSEGQGLVPHVLALPHPGYLSVLRVLREGAGPQNHGQQETLRPEEGTHLLQRIPSRVLLLAIL